MSSPSPVIQVDDQVIPLSQFREMIFSTRSGSTHYGSYARIVGDRQITLANLHIPSRFYNASDTSVENAGEVVGYILKLISQLSTHSYWFSVTSDKDRLVLTEQGDRVVHAFKLVEKGIDEDGVLKLAFIDGTEN